MSDTEGFNVAVGTSRMILCFHGIWPNSRRKENWLSYVRLFIFIFVMVFFINIPQTLLATSLQDFNAIVEVLVVSDVPIGMAALKMFGFWYNRDSQLVITMAEDWKNIKTQEELQIMWKNAKLSRLMSIVIISLAEGTIITYFIMTTFFNRTIQSLSIGNVTKYSRPLYFSSKFFYDVQKSPQYEITWIFQCFGTIFSASTFSAIDAFFAVLILHLCGQLKNLALFLKSLPKKVAENDDFIHMMSTVTVRHRNLKRFANAIEDSFNLMLLVQMLVYSIIICIQGFQLVVITTTGDGIPFDELLFMIYYIACFIFSLFIYCYVAEILRGESMAVCNAAYESNWYDLSPLEKKLLIFTMIQAKEPFTITAGKFVAFSLNLYCKILKSSGGYVSMLLAMSARLTS